MRIAKYGIMALSMMGGYVFKQNKKIVETQLPTSSECVGRMCIDNKNFNDAYDSSNYGENLESSQFYDKSPNNKVGRYTHTIPLTFIDTFILEGVLTSALMLTPLPSTLKNGGIAIVKYISSIQSFDEYNSLAFQEKGNPTLLNGDCIFSTNGYIDERVNPVCKSSRLERGVEIVTNNQGNQTIDPRKILFVGATLSKETEIINLQLSGHPDCKFKNTICNINDIEETVRKHELEFVYIDNLPVSKETAEVLKVFRELDLCIIGGFTNRLEAMYAAYYGGEEDLFGTISMTGNGIPPSYKFDTIKEIPIVSLVMMYRCVSEFSTASIHMLQMLNDLGLYETCLNQPTKYLMGPFLLGAKIFLYFEQNNKNVMRGHYLLTMWAFFMFEIASNSNEYIGSLVNYNTVNYIPECAANSSIDANKLHKMLGEY